MKKTEIVNLLPFFLLVIVLGLVFIDKPFFWDKDILDSKQAHWLFYNSFNLLFPNDLDSGHPPFVAFLLAFSWVTFGKSLAVSHLIMLPFSLGVVYQSYLLVKKFTSELKLTTLALLLLDTSLLTQVIVVSSDLIIIFLFLVCINSILSGKRIYLLVSLIFLALVNMRGMVTCFGIFLFDSVYNYRKENIKAIFRNGLYYLPGALMAGSFIVFHFVNKGWIMYHENSPWVGCFEKVVFQGIIRNIIIFIWRIFDFGRIIYAIFLCIIIVKFVKGKTEIPAKYKPLYLLLIILLLTYLPYFKYQNLLSFRYLLPFIYILSLTTILLIFHNFKRKILAMAITGTFLVAGNFIIYPDKIAQGWDATLAHIPYHSLHKKMINYLDENKIEFTDVGTVTPNKSEMKYIYLNNDERKFAEKDFSKNRYMLFSNCFNDFTDDEIDTLKNKWNIVVEFKKINIKMILYKNPEF